jgi:hypothetical protein
MDFVAVMRGRFVRGVGAGVADCLNAVRFSSHSPAPSEVVPQPVAAQVPVLAVSSSAVGCGRCGTHVSACSDRQHLPKPHLTIAKEIDAPTQTHMQTCARSRARSRARSHAHAHALSKKAGDRAHKQTANQVTIKIESTHPPLSQP